MIAIDYGLLICVVATSMTGLMTILLGYLALRSMKQGLLKIYATFVFIALLIFSTAGVLRSAREVLDQTLIFGINVVYIEYVFYSITYLELMLAIYMIHIISKVSPEELKLKAG
ncbi:MAG: hypothetical protein QXQ02_02605 [Halobacteria archaeon]